MYDTVYDNAYIKKEDWKPNPKTKFGEFFIKFKENTKKEKISHNCSDLETYSKSSEGQDRSGLRHHPYRFRQGTKGP